MCSLHCTLWSTMSRNVDKTSNKSARDADKTSSKTARDVDKIIPYEKWIQFGIIPKVQ